MKVTTFKVKVRRRGTIALPKALRDRNRIEERERLTLHPLGDGVTIMHRRRSRVDELADQLAAELQASGETLESMLDTLREVRAEHDKEG